MIYRTLIQLIFTDLLGAGRFWWLIFAQFVAAIPLLAQVASPIPPAPQLLWPRDGMEMTDAASFFRWAPMKGCDSYEIQIASDREFQGIVRQRLTKNVRYHEDCYFQREVLSPGQYCWRVRAKTADTSGPWSDVFSVKVNGDHSLAPRLVREISAEHPVFLMRNRAFDPRTVPLENLQRILPDNLAGVIVPDDIALWTGASNAVERARRYNELGIDFVIWNNRARAPLCFLEYCFQNFRHCIGTAEGEHIWSYGWEKGPEGNISEWDYLRRAYLLCGKYGRYYFQGEGEPTNYKWTLYSQDYREDLARYRRNIVPMFKSTLGMVALHSVGAVEGLMASGTVENCGFWEDEFIWKECGFGKLGEFGAPNSLGKGTELCPWTYDIQMWLIGIVSGSTVFQLESAHQWKSDASANANYTRHFLPFVKAVVEHRLIPSRRAFLDSLRAAVATDYQRAKAKHHDRFEGDFAFLRELYALKNTPFQEVIPDHSRYGLIALLPPGATCLNGKTKTVSLDQLATPGEATRLFDASYPSRFKGEAFQWECDGTVMVMNANENRDVPQSFAMKLPRGPVREISGSIGVHQYIVGKIAPEGREFWLQTNGEHPERAQSVSFASDAELEVEVQPSSAKVDAQRDEAAHRLTLTLSVKDGPAECVVRRKANKP